MVKRWPRCCLIVSITSENHRTRLTHTRGTCQGASHAPAQALCRSNRARRWFGPRCRWRDCPPDYGPSTTICNRFNRRSHRGLWTRIFVTLSAQAELPDDLSIDSTAVRAHRSAHGGKGGRRFRPSVARQAIAGNRLAGGRSRGGPIPKTHALTDGCGRAVAFLPSPGNCADISAAPALLDKMPAPSRLLADKGYDANSLRQRLATTKTEAVIPSTRARKIPIPCDVEACVGRNLIERAFRRRKDWRRIATRYDKLASTFDSAIATAASMLWWT